MPLLRPSDVQRGHPADSRRVPAVWRGAHARAAAGEAGPDSARRPQARAHRGRKPARASYGGLTALQIPQVLAVRRAVRRVALELFDEVVVLVLVLVGILGGLVQLVRVALVLDHGPSFVG